MIDKEREKKERKTIETTIGDRKRRTQRGKISTSGLTVAAGGRRRSGGKPIFFFSSCLDYQKWGKTTRRDQKWQKLREIADLETEKTDGGK